MRRPVVLWFALAIFSSAFLFGQQNKPAPSPAEQSIEDQLKVLRQLPDAKRGEATTRLALDIRKLPKTDAKVGLADALAGLSTEGDFGRRTLQEVATTLALSLAEHPLPDKDGEPASPYITLAQLVRYEGVTVSLDAVPYRAAMEELEKDERQRASADFTLLDLSGKPLTLRGLRGHVVLVNFWATWCPPCRKEIPDLAALYSGFTSHGLVILGISDETADKVAPFVKTQKVPYPILLDPGDKVHKLFSVEGIPKSFLYDREGRLVATAIDMRTRQQFLAMLAKAGLVSAGTQSGILSLRMEATKASQSGQLAAAEEKLKEALGECDALLPDSYQLKTDLLRDLGNLYSSEKQLDKAESAYKMRLEILGAQQKEGQTPILDIGIALFDLQTIYEVRGPSSEAQSYMTQAVMFYTTCMNSFPELRSVCDRRLADVQGLHGSELFLQKRYDEAIPYLDAVIARGDNEVRPEVLSAALTARSKIFLTSNEPAKAQALALRAIQIRAANPTHFAASTPRTGTEIPVH